MLPYGTGGPHSNGPPIFLCKPGPITAVYNQAIIGMRIAGMNCSRHYLTCRWNNITYTLAERVSKPDMALVIDIDAGDMRSGTVWRS